MSAGSIKLQASDTRIATVTFEDGAVGNVNVVVPKEGGVLASEDYVASQSYTKTEADTLLSAKQTAAQVTAAITAQKASSTVYGTAKISVSGSTLTITTI